jgi:hypothetical protein
MEEIQLSAEQALIYSLIPVGIGFLLGLVPLVLGIMKRKLRLGLFGLIASTIGGAILGVILSIPAMAVFTWLIVRDGFVAEDVVSHDEVPASEDDTKF